MTNEQWANDPDAQLDAWYEAQGASVPLEEDHCADCGLLFRPTRPTTLCPECAARRAEEWENWAS